MNGNGWGMGVGWGIFGWIFMLLFWILVVFGIVILIKWLTNQSKPETKENTTMEILKQRYVKGEIDKKEFEEKKKDLA
ncbi:SHOCT domain-containing protein [Patescibacteria group bacterium]|nr:SHOCT domain-containing protein [Patescibacteria group bacterium]